MADLLCQNCRTGFDGRAPRIEGSRDDQPQYYLHRNYASFQQSREAHCRLCCDLWSKAAAHFKIPLQALLACQLMVGIGVFGAQPSDNNGRTQIRCMWWTYTLFVKETASSLAILGSGHTTEQSLFPPTSEFHKSVFYRRVFFLSESPKQWQDDSRSPEAIGSSSGSPQALELAKSWVSSCIDHHNECKPWRDLRHDPASPARILDVQDPNSTTVRLRILEGHEAAAEFDEEYATLSYCRDGPFLPVQLTETTREELVAGIGLWRLPRTFRDAVMLTRHLGLRYLWIDRLCIFQDSERDRRAEGEKAGDIYENGLVNMVAAGAADCRDGLFFGRNARDLQPLQFKITWPIYQTAVGSTHTSSHTTTTTTFTPRLYDCVGIDDWEANVGSGPTYQSEPWTLQEQFLARRNLHCCKQQLYWECKRGKANESFPEGFSILSDANLTKFLEPTNVLDRISRLGSWKISGDTGEIEFQPPSDGTLVRDAYEEWMALVETYTARDHSRTQDMLLGISGIAKRFETLLGDRYLSGLFLRNLCANLLWFTTDPSAVRLSTEEDDLTNTKWKAPTWSWAAVNGQVEWDWDSFTTAEPRFPGESLEGDLLEYVGHEKFSTFAGGDTVVGSRAEPSTTTRLKVKTRLLSFHGNLRAPPGAPLLRRTGVHGRVMYMRTSPSGIHHGIAQFDDAEALGQAASSPDSRGNTNPFPHHHLIHGIPVRWRFQKVPGTSSSDLGERALLITGLIVRPANGYLESYERLLRIGRFKIYAVAGRDGNEDTINELLKHMLPDPNNSDLIGEFVLI